MDNFNPYEIIGVSKRFTLDELKYNYKKVAKRVHPDRGGNEKLFKLVTLAYKQLLEIHKLKQINKEFNELKSDFQEFTTNQDNQQRRHRDLHRNSDRSSKKSSRSRQNQQDSNGNFGDMFNKVYEENKIEDVYDRGYGDLMTESDANRPDIDIKKTVNSMKNFNQAFDSAPVSKHNKKIIKYRDPIALPTSLKTLQYTEIGIDKLSDFSTETSNLSCVDYKKAHSTSKLIDKNYVRQRTGYNDIGGLEAERANIDYNMSEEDLRKQAYLKKKEQLKELKRLERLQQMDMMHQESFNRVNELMVNYKQ
jgi:curved DNA-binding protein CbpA